jgi:DNA mismatch repair protein MutL
VGFAVEHDGREVFSTTGQGDLRSAILSLYGREVARSMVSVDFHAEGPLEGILGYVSDPETTRASPTYISTYVNGRYVRSGVIRNAIIEAYGTQLAPSRYPFAVLDLDVPPETVDVNVHPRKMEVRFGEEREIKAQIEKIVGETLLEEGFVRSSAPRGRSTPEETTITPEADKTGKAEQRDESDDVGSSLQNPPASSSPQTESTDRPATAPEWAVESPETNRSTGASETRTPNGTQRFSTPTQTTFGEPEESEYARLPDLRVLGQLHETYIVCETDDGLVLIDQHAADERVHYERLSERLAGETATQTLVSPVEIELTARETALFDAYEEALAHLGFAATREEGTIRMRTVPAAFDTTLSPTLLRDALSECLSGDPGNTIEATIDSLLGDLACHPAVTGNTSLTEGSVVELLSALDDCENPSACPHGRPTMIRIDGEELSDRFERDYPGHTERRADETN